MRDKTNIILIGGGGHCRSVIDVIESTGLYHIKGILDEEDKVGEVILGHKVIGGDELILDLIRNKNSFCISLGQIKSSQKRIKYFKLISELGGIMPVIVSPNSVISKSVSIGSGTVVHHNCILNVESVIGENCIINTGAVIEHETEIGNHCHISTGAYVNGQCVVGESVFLGSKSVVSNNIRIVNNSLIGAGSVVIKDIQEAGVYFGNPVSKR